MRIKREYFPRKQSAGRHAASAKKKKHYQVMIEPSIAEKVRRDGGDNLSRGLSNLSQINACLSRMKDKYEAALKAIVESTIDQKARKAALDALVYGITSPTESESDSRETDPTHPSD
jgi:hypothetical protein